MFNWLLSQSLSGTGPVAFRAFLATRSGEIKQGKNIYGPS